MTRDLDKIALKHGTDKSSAFHGYTRHYQRYLTDLPRVGKVLELGWGGHEDPNAGGASARMWADWLPNWSIVAVDLAEKNRQPGDSSNIMLLDGTDQTDAGLPHYGPFDVIIDDASHLSSLTIQSFELLWPSLAPGGWYVVEDTHMAYHSHYYGGEEAHENPDGKLPGGRRTAMQFLRRLADEANFQGRGELDLFPRKHWLGYEVEEIHFHFNICFIRKRV